LNALLLSSDAHHGLGRVNDYLQNFFAGFPISGPQAHWASWPGIIPNSQLIVFPYHPRVPTEWTLELLVSPSRSLLQVGLAVLVACVACALAALVFHVRERRQDRADQRKAAHVLTF
jgi:integrin alpha FG-GAP repeat containing protein 1